MKKAFRSSSDVSVNAEYAKRKKKEGKEKEECMSHMTDEVMHVTSRKAVPQNSS